MRGRIRRLLKTPDLAIEQSYFLMGQAALIAQRSARTCVKDLWDAEISVYSQWGEDGILDFLCEITGLSHPRAIEFGAGDFSECNTRGLATYRQASVMAVDAREDLLTSIMSSDIRWRTTVIPRVEWITPDSAPLALESARKMFGGVEIVSLDIDGNDYWVAEGLDLQGVQIVVVEYNPAFGGDWAVSVPRDDHFDRTSAHVSWVYYGASLRGYIQLMQSKGFSFVGTNRAMNNAFFLQSDEIPDSLPMPDSDLSKYVDVRFREARALDGSLTLTHPAHALQASPELPLIDLATGETVKVGAVVGQ